jgi:transglutaminase-like putative cysteine protease
VRFAAVHKACTYLVAIAAFSAVALSGELDPFTMLFGLGGITVSWWAEPPRMRVERLAVPLTALALAAFLLNVVLTLGGENIILGGARFLTVLLVIKLLSRRAAKDYQQIYLLAFLLLTTGTAMNTGLSFAVSFLVFSIAITWALMLFHLRREMEENFLLKHADAESAEKVQVERILGSRRIVGSSFLLATSAVSLATFVGAVLVFVMFPRVGLGFFFQQGRAGVSVAGFSDQVKLGGHGTIRDDDTVVMRVYLDDPAWKGPNAPPLHFRGIAFDRYENGLWSRSKALRPTAGGVATGGEWVYPNLDASPQRRAERRELAHTGLRQDIYVEPLDTTVLFGAATPRAFRVPLLPTPEPRRPIAPELYGGDEVRQTRAQGIRYEVWSEPTPPPAATLAAARDADPQRLATYLVLPPDLPARVGQLARDLTAGAVGPYQKTMRIHDFLQREFSYTLEQDTDDDYEPLDYFLFERKKGHCEYFSSAMAVLLREVGVPTRNVNGFLGGEWNEYGGYLAVRGGDAHSWVEIWFDGAGWVTWDPTPSASLERRSGFGDRIRRLFDTLKLRWFKWVIEYDLQKQLAVFRRIGGLFGSTSGKASAKAMGGWIKRHRTHLAVGLGLGLVALGVWALLKRKWEPEPERRERRRRREPLLLLYAKVAELMAKRVAPRRPGDTPREHARAAMRAGSPAAAPFAALTELYYRARFEREGLAPLAELGEAQALAQAVRAALKQKPPGKTPA